MRLMTSLRYFLGSVGGILNKVHCIVDSREVKTVQAAVSRMVAVDEIKALRSGDFSLQVDDVKLGMERKTISDFLGSLKSGRLLSQFKRMNEDYNVRVLLLEGTWKVADNGHVVYRNRDLKWHVASFQMAVYALTRQFNITPVWVPDLNGLAWTIRSFYRRAAIKGIAKDVEDGTIEWSAYTKNEELDDGDRRNSASTNLRTRNVAGRAVSRNIQRGPLDWSQKI